MKKPYTPEFKAKVVRELLREEKSVSQIAAAYGVDPKRLYEWRATALTGLPSLFSDRAAQEQLAKEQAHAEEIERLYVEIGKLTTQLAWLKKKGGDQLDIS